VPSSGPRLLGADRRATVARAFGERVRGLRIAKGLSEGELAERCGVPPATITRTELGGKEPPLCLILSLSAGLDVLPGVLVEDLLSAGSHAVESRFEAKIAALTPREKEVLEGLSRAESNGEIAYELKIGVETVRTHVARIRRKLGVRSQRTLVRRGGSASAGVRVSGRTRRQEHSYPPKSPEDHPHRGIDSDWLSL
jgi:DNA-binding CsgD family transcriptional regulator